MSSEQRSEKRGEKRGLVSVLAFTAIAVLCVYVAYSIISDNVQIKEYQQQYDSLSAELQAVEESNAEINRYLEDGADLDSYIENQAREKLDYAKPDEKIFYIVPSAGE